MSAVDFSAEDLHWLFTIQKRLSKSSPYRRVIESEIRQRAKR